MRILNNLNWKGKTWIRFGGNDDVKLELILRSSNEVSSMDNKSICEQGTRRIVVGVEQNYSVACVALKVAAFIGHKLGMSVGKPERAKCTEDSGMNLPLQWAHCLPNLTCLPKARCQADNKHHCCPGYQKLCDVGEGICRHHQDCRKGLVCGNFTGSCRLRPGFDEKDKCCKHPGEQT